MYEQFTDRARKVMQLANQEAQRFNHEYIGTEHILLGLIKEGSGVAANVLKNLDIDLRKIRIEVEKLVQSGPDMVTMGKLPQTPRAKKVIEYSMEEARNLGHNYVGTEHLLLGLIREGKGLTSRIFARSHLALEHWREHLFFEMRTRYCLLDDTPRHRNVQPCELDMVVVKLDVSRKDTLGSALHPNRHRRFQRFDRRDHGAELILVERRQRVEEQ